MRRPVQTSPILALPLLALPLLWACAASRVPVPMLRPAEINLSRYQTLGLAELGGGPVASAVSGLLEEKLVGGQRFQLVDRQRLQSVMSELQLASSDLADAKNSVKLGNILTAGALITGDVQERWQEQQHESRFTNKAGEQHFHRYTTARLTVEATFRLTDVSTGALLIVRRVSAERTHGPASSGAQLGAALLGALLSSAVEQSQDYTDPPPDRARMEDAARAEVVSRFVAAIQPTTRTVEVEFATDGAVPQLAAGVGWARRGDWGKAQQTFNDAIADSERNPGIGAAVLSKAYRNAGLAYVYASDFDKGLKLLDKAYALSGGEARILDDIDAAHRLQAESKALAEQGPVPQPQ